MEKKRRTGNGSSAGEVLGPSVSKVGGRGLVTTTVTKEGWLGAEVVLDLAVEGSLVRRGSHSNGGKINVVGKTSGFLLSVFLVKSGLGRSGVGHVGKLLAALDN